MLKGEARGLVADETAVCLRKGELDNVPTGMVAVFSVLICLGAVMIEEGGGICDTGELVAVIDELETVPIHFSKLFDSVFTITLVPKAAGFSTTFSNFSSGFSETILFATFVSDLVISFSGDGDFRSFFSVFSDFFSDLGSFSEEGSDLFSTMLSTL